MPKIININVNKIRVIFFINTYSDFLNDFIKSISTIFEVRVILTSLNNKNTSYYLYPRSSIIKTPLRLSNSVGIIDAGYRGNIIACVDNIKNYEFKIEKGSRLFQICGPTLEPIEIRVINELSNSQRGSGGFGSTG